MERTERPKLSRREALAGAAAFAASPALAQAAAPLIVTGALKQGGFAVIRTAPGAQVLVDGEAVRRASSRGIAVVGFDRDAPAAVRVAVQAQAASAERTLAIAPRPWSVQRIDGLPPQTVAPTDPAVIAKIQADAALKARAFASDIDSDDFAQGFRWPVQGRVSSSFGNQRILNGVPGRPHYGVDIAAGRGTPIVAPAGGTVVLARPDMHFEGGLVVIDHGQGLNGAFLHLSSLAVREGQRVSAGQRIGAVGATGRATGPHLCWRLKWRDRNLDPSLWTEPLTA